MLASRNVVSLEYSSLVLLRYNFRLYPSPGQRARLARAFGCATVVFNDGLAARDAHTAGLPWITDAEFSARLTASKHTTERAWLCEVSAVVLQQALADLNTAYRNFSASRAGRRKGRQMGLPRFRSRKDRRQAIRFTANARWTITPSGQLRLPKVGNVPVRWSRQRPSRPSSVTVIRDSAGRYFASFVLQVMSEPLPQSGSRFLRRAEKKLKRRQRELSRKEKDSQNRQKARVKVARAHARVAELAAIFIISCPRR